MGLYLIEQANGQRQKLPGPFAENGASKLIIQLPLTMGAGTYHIEIVSQYTHGGGTFKELRTISYPVDLTVTRSPCRGEA